MRVPGSSDRVYLGIVAALVLAGLAILSSATGPVAYSKFNSSFWFVWHQMLYGLLPGIAMFAFTAHFPYTRYRPLAGVFFIFALLLLIAVFIPGISAPWGSSKSWLALGGLSLQPSELAKLLLILCLSAWLIPEIGGRPRVLRFLGVLFFVSFLLALEPDIGTLTIIAAIATTVYFVAGAPLAHIAGIAIAGAAGIYTLIAAAPYRAARFLTFLHPELDPRGIGYHINQALLAIGSGGLWGLGYGRSRQKFLYLPEVSGDSIFAVAAEELGFFLSVAFMLLFTALVWRGIRIARRAPDTFGLLVATGITAWFGLQAAVNIGSMVGLLPLTGLTLPFVSYGGTSLAVSLAASGIMINISRRG